MFIGTGYWGQSGLGAFRGGLLGPGNSRDSLRPLCGLRVILVTSENNNALHHCIAFNFCFALSMGPLQFEGVCLFLLLPLISFC